MNEAKRSFIAFLVENQAVQFGEFTLKSGDRSPFFVDLGQVRTGKGLDQLGRAFAGGLREHYPEATLLFGPAYKGIALASAASIGCWNAHRQDLPVLYNRKESKGHGEKGAFIGQSPTSRDRVVIVDDVLSSGGTKVEAAQSLETAFGIRPIGVLVAVDRTRRDSGYDSAALPARALVDLRDLSAFLRATGDPRADLVDRFWEGAR